MFTQALLLFLYTESPLHVGSGRDTGVVDLPIQRDKVTQYPIVQASSLKGKLRAELPTLAASSEGINDDAINTLFGQADNNSLDDEGKSYAGAISPSDARILLFPVRSLNGVFAWVTSFDVLMRFTRDAALAKQTTTWTIPSEGIKNDAAWVSPTSAVNNQKTVTLEEFTYTVQPDPFVQKLGDWLAKNALPQTDEYTFWRQKLAKHLVILPDDDFRDFSLYGTEVNTRIKLVPETKTVKSGALWTEENLPSDALLYAPIAVGDSREYRAPSAAPKFEATAITRLLEEALHNKRFQLGCDETVGRGYVMATVKGGDPQ